MEEEKRTRIDEHWRAVEAALDRFMARYAPNGRFEKFGQTEQCLAFREFDDYAGDRLSKVRRKRYEAHFDACGDCRDGRDKLMEYLASQRSSGRIAGYARAVVAWPHRIADYFSEKKAERREKPL